MLPASFEHAVCIILAGFPPSACPLSAPFAWFRHVLLREIRQIAVQLTPPPFT
jgi:hypothetical protein